MLRPTELVTVTEKTTTNQLERSAQLRTRATQTAASIEPNHITPPLKKCLVVGILNLFTFMSLWESMKL